MNLAVLKMYFTKQKHDPSSTGTIKSLNRELMKHDVNNIDYEIVHETVLSIFNAHTP